MFCKSSGNFTVRLFLTDVWITFPFWSILKKEAEGFFFFPTTGFLYFELSVRRFEVCAPKFIVQNDSTVNNGLLTVLLLISEQSISPRGHSGEFTNAGEEELTSHRAGKLSLLFSGHRWPCSSHCISLLLHRSCRNAQTPFLIFLHRSAYLQIRSH